MKPSHVFFGDNLINGVLPKKKPKKYAATSLIAIREAGNRNLYSFSIGKQNALIYFIDMG